MTSPSGGQFITSEQVLERLFRAGFAHWVEDAKGHLGGDAAYAAPRVVSKAFHNAWIDRQRLRSQEELDAFLGANIAHGSARELTKRVSAQRMVHAAEGKGAHDHVEMTVDEAWERLSHTLQGGTPEAARERASAARHGAADHISKLAKSSFNWRPIAFMAVIAVAVGIGGVWYLKTAGAERDITTALAAKNVRKYETSVGQQAKVSLDDGTMALVGPDSRLTVPNLFGEALRSVGVDGAVNFEVTRAQKKPFEVRSGGVVIAGTDAVFTMHRYKADKHLVLLVRKGAVDVRMGDATRHVTEGMGLLVDSEGAMSVPSSEELEEASSWVDGTVSITGYTLRDALPRMKRWFGLDIKVQDTTLLDRKVFVRAPMGGQKTAIAAAEQSGGVKFTYIKDAMAFVDAQPSKGTRKP
jgi:ferric-dicitrate binding protein FerR (iron transport regulator)